MTIEATLERIANALETIAAGQGQLPLTTAAPPAAEPAKRRGRPPAAATPAPVAEPDIELGGGEAEAADDFLGTEEAVKYTLEQVREKIVAYQKRVSPDAARKLLKEIGGVDSLRLLPEGKYAEIVAATEKK